MKNVIFLLLLICADALSSLAQETTEFGKIEPFEEHGKWGLKINGEVILLPMFEFIRPDGNYFIFKENGKEGVMSSRSILCPAVYDNILKIYDTHDIVIYETEAGRGVQQFKVPKFVDSSNNIVDGTKFVMNIEPGQYKDFILSPDAKPGSSLFYAVCETHNGEFRIIDIYGNDMTPYYDLKKLKGNIKDVLEGKIPLSDLRVNAYVSDIEKNFKKAYKKHPEFYYFNHPYLRKIKDKEELSEKNAIATISAGPYQGFITEDGFVSIPILYSDAEEVLKRDPSNLYALNYLLFKNYRYECPKMPDTMFMDSNQRFDAYHQYHAERYEFYSAYIPVWEKMLALARKKKEKAFIDLFSGRLAGCRELTDESYKELRGYDKVAAVTGTLDSVARNLMNTASVFNESTSSGSPGYSANAMVSDSASFSAGVDKSSLSEQTSYNRDKKTYERYDSQLSSHFAGNQTMSISSVKDAQNSMRSLRTKWESKGKSFPHSTNEDR